MAAIFTFLGTAVSAVGTIAGGAAQANAAAWQARAQEMQAQAYEFRAKQQEQQAAESRAAAQREADEKRREGRLVQSQLIARAAASGGSATDATVLGKEKEVVGQLVYNALTETYRGENRARGFEDEATASRWSAESSRVAAGAALAQGQAQRSAAMWGGIGTLVSAAGSAFKTYNGVSTPTYSPTATASMSNSLYPTAPAGTMTTSFYPANALASSAYAPWQRKLTYG